MTEITNFHEERAHFYNESDVISQFEMLKAAITTADEKIVVNPLYLKSVQSIELTLLLSCWRSSTETITITDISCFILWVKHRINCDTGYEVEMDTDFNNLAMDKTDFESVGYFTAYLAKQLNLEPIYQCIDTLLLKPFLACLPITEHDPFYQLPRSQSVWQGDSHASFPFNELCALICDNQEKLKENFPDLHQAGYFQVDYQRLNVNQILMFSELLIKSLLTEDSEELAKHYWFFDHLISESCNKMLFDCNSPETKELVPPKKIAAMKERVNSVLNEQHDGVQSSLPLNRISSYIHNLHLFNTFIVGVNNVSHIFEELGADSKEQIKEIKGELKDLYGVCFEPKYEVPEFEPAN